MVRLFRVKRCCYLIVERTRVWQIVDIYWPSSGFKCYLFSSLTVFLTQKKPEIMKIPDVTTWPVPARDMLSRLHRNMFKEKVNIKGSIVRKRRVLNYTYRIHIIRKGQLMANSLESKSQLQPPFPRSVNEHQMYDLPSNSHKPYMISCSLQRNKVNHGVKNPKPRS